MNSQLGRIQLGTWELGQALPTPVTTGSFTAKAFPTGSAKGQGGILRPFTSVLGTIQLGIFELGQVPAGSVTAGEVTGKGSFLAKAFPTASATALPATGSFSASAFPITAANGNKGPLLVVFRAFPITAAEGINYYAEGSFVCAPDPITVAQGVRPGAAIFAAFPTTSAAPLQGQQVSCIVGPNTPDAEIENYAY